eukprot:EC824813.1.p1 GENE.EC824813.1~~EC824813.1.p1  ORF type:complete len:143 (+),score=17.72 EC824813.1:259-687(+)
MCDGLLLDNIQQFSNFLFIVLGNFAIVIYTTSGWFAIILVPICIVYIILYLFYRGTSRDLKRLESTNRSPLYAHFAETLSGLGSIRAYSQQENYLQKNLTIDRYLYSSDILNHSCTTMAFIQIRVGWCCFDLCNIMYYPFNG